MKSRWINAKSFGRLWLLAACFAIIVAFIPESAAYADHCPDEPWNLADCLRTPGYREWYVTALVALGVTPTLLAQILAEASKSSLTDQDVNKFIREKILEKLKGWMQSGIARQAGANLATRTADILDSLSKDSTTSQPTTPAPSPVTPVVVPTFPPGEIVSGVDAKNFLQSTGALDKLSKLRKGAGWQKIIAAMRGDPGKAEVTDFSIEWNDDGTPNLDNLVFIMPGTAPVPPTPPPPPPPVPDQLVKPEEAPDEAKQPEQKPNGKKPVESPEKPPKEKVEPPKETPPPSLRELLDQRRRERDDAWNKRQSLKDKEQELTRKYKDAEKEWNYTRVKGFWGGVVDIADALADILSGTYKINLLQTETFGGAYLKDLVKNTLKGILTNLHAEGTPLPDMSKVTWRDLEFAVTPTGIVPSSLPSQDLDKIMDHAIPGGGIKQLIQNYLESHPKTKPISTIYGPGETILKGSRDVKQAMDECAALRSRMNQLGNELGKVRSQIEDADMAYEVADGAVKSTQEDINQLKELFPNRFRNL